MTNTPQATHNFFTMLAAATKDVLSQIAASVVEVDLTPATYCGSALELRFDSEGAVAGAFTLRLAAADVAFAAALLMGDEPGYSASPNQEQCEAAIELSRQICGNLAAALRARFGSLEIRGSSSETANVGLNHRTRLQARVAERNLSFEVAISDEFQNSLQKAEKIIEKKEVEHESSSYARSGQSCDNSTDPDGGGKPIHSSHNGNLDMLLDLELPVTLRFGCREMLLKEVIELTSGSVLELDRRVREPVDLLIHNKLIARGEVVLVEGNYGVRILEVANERDRIACLP